jgi:hypothetical protein
MGNRIRVESVGIINHNSSEDAEGDRPLQFQGLEDWIGCELQLNLLKVLYRHRLVR